MRLADLLRRHALAFATTGASLAVVAACADLKSGADSEPEAPSSTVLGTGPRDPSASGADGGGSGGSSGATSSGASGGASSGASGGASSGATSSGGTSSGGTNPWSSFGPGPDGPLPTGVCCTADTECRSGACLEVGVPGETVRMCSDRCTSDGACKRPSTTMLFTCVDANQACVIETFENVRCIPRDQHTVGTKPLGACCTLRADADNGLECASGVCASAGGGPGVCTRTCAKSADCATGYACEGAPRGRCVPTSAAYTCQ